MGTAIRLEDLTPALRARVEGDLDAIRDQGRADALTGADLQPPYDSPAQERQYGRGYIDGLDARLGLRPRR